MMGNLLDLGERRELEMNLEEAFIEAYNALCDDILDEETFLWSIEKIPTKIIKRVLNEKEDEEELNIILDILRAKKMLK